MTAKAILFFCAQALFVQNIYGQCAGYTNAALAAEGLAYGAGLGAYGAPGCGAANYGLNIGPTSGGGFALTSSSPIAPTGISVISDNAIEGVVSVAGELPFLSVVALEGALPTAGAGGINYGCGSGAVGIMSEGIAPGAGSGYPGAYGAAGVAGRQYGPAQAGAGGYGARSLGLGCGAVY